MIAIMIAGATAMIVSLAGSRFLISFFRNRGKGQPILGKEDRGPEHHMSKSGTPTMGGLAIVVAAYVGWIPRVTTSPAHRAMPRFNSRKVFNWHPQWWLRSCT